MTTEADDRLDNVDRLVRDALGQMSRVIIDRCDGSGDYTPEYDAKLHEVFAELLHIKQLLGRR